MFSDAKEFQKLRPDLTLEQVNDVLGFLADQYDQGATFFNDNEAFISAADYMFPKVNHG